MGFQDDYPIIKDFVTAVIASGASLSGAVDLRGVVLVGVNMPADWTAADLTFQATHEEAGTYQNVFDADDAEVTVQAAEDRYIVLEPAKYAGIRFLKVRSGTSGTPVNQAAARTLVLLVRPV